MVEEREGDLPFFFNKTNEVIKEEIAGFLKAHTIVQIQRDNAINIRFADYYNKIFHDDICQGCPGAFSAAYDKLNNFINSNQPIIMESTSQFQMEKDVVIYDRLSHAHYSNKNITDEAALNLIATNPKYANSFPVKPDGWEQMVKQHKSGLNKSKDMEQEQEQEKQPSEIEQELFSSTRKTLQLKCSAMNLPADQWSQLKRDDLAAYLLKEISKAATAGA